MSRKTSRVQEVDEDSDDDDGAYINIQTVSPGPSRGGSTKSNTSISSSTSISTSTSTSTSTSISTSTSTSTSTSRPPAGNEAKGDDGEDEDDYLTVVVWKRMDPHEPATEEPQEDKKDTLERLKAAVEAAAVDTGAVVEMLLTCLGCNRRLQSPKLLLCRHTLCLACVKAGVQSPDAVTCWVCHKPQPLPPGGVDELSDSPTFVTLMQSEVKDGAPAAAGAGVESTCGVCDESRPIKKFCPTCSMSMCASCTIGHSKFLETKKHELVSPKALDPLTLVTSRQRVTCRKHDEAVTSFCQSCGVMTCQKCYQDQHQGHPQDLTAPNSHQVRKVKATILTSVKRAMRATSSLSKDVDRFHQDVASETEKLCLKLQGYQRRSTRLLTESLEKLSADVREKGSQKQEVCRKLVQEKETREESLKLLKGLLVRMTDNDTMSDVDTQALTAFCKRKLRNITTSQNQDVSTRISRHFRPSLALLQVLSMTSAGTLVDVGRYPRIVTPAVKSSFSSLADPSGLAITPYGEFLCASYMNKSLALYSPTGTLIRDMSADVTLPWGTCVTMEGLLLVTECNTENARPMVKVFSPAGTLLRSLGSGKALSCMGLAVTMENEVAVCDENGASVHVFRLDGSVVRTCMNDAVRKSEYLFQGPMHVAVNVNGDLVVCDDHRIIKIVTADGRLRAQFPKVEVPSQQDRHFEGLCTDSKGQIIVADSGKRGLHVLTMEGHERAFVPLTSDLAEVMAVVVTPDNQLAVASREAKVAILDVFVLE